MTINLTNLERAQDEINGVGDFTQRLAAIERVRPILAAADGDAGVFQEKRLEARHARGIHGAGVRAELRVELFDGVNHFVDSAMVALKAA